MATQNAVRVAPPPLRLHVRPGIRRGQFILGPSAPKGLPQWKHQELAVGLWLATHPTLNVTRVVESACSLTLVGFMLDATNPAANDTEILTRLLAHATSRHRLIEATANLAGRWILIVDGVDGRYLFNDALGLRQVFYTMPATNDVWALSQPGLAIDVLQLEKDEQALEFVDSHEFRAHPEYRWPGASSPVRGLRHLLPNHTLDLRHGTVTRYWPLAPLPQIAPATAIETIAKQLEGSLRAAAMRFDLTLSLTAGIDSRLVLAASRSITKHLRCATVRQARMADTNADLLISKRLAEKAGLRHDVVRAAVSTSPEFSLAFKRSVYLAHDRYGADAEAILGHFGGTHVAVTGSGGEVGRCFFYKYLPRWRRDALRATDLAKLQNMNEHPYALRFFEEWLQEARQLGQINLLDLFYWEQGQGNWLAMTQLEFDIAWRDIFTPYNCRTLLETFLSVDERYRRGPGYRLFKGTIEYLWPEMLSEPINPKPHRSFAVKLTRYASRAIAKILH